MKILRIIWICLLVVMVLVCAAFFAYQYFVIGDSIEVIDRVTETIEGLGSEPEPEPEPEVETEEIPAGREVYLPILIYHHLVEGDGEASGAVISENRFREQIAAVKDAGYNTVTLEQLIAFTECRGELPENPILITMDDGYNSNLTIAAPILEEYGYTAVIFAIGTNVGHPNHAHSGVPLVPARFTWEDAAVWSDKGVIEVQSHTYDMHQNSADGYPCRDGVLQMAGESEDDYRVALRVDFSRAKAQLEDATGKKMIALAFPYGYYSDIALEEAKNIGVKVTFLADHGGNYVVSGEPESLHLLYRINGLNRISGESMVRQIEQAKETLDRKRTKEAETAESAESGETGE